MAFHFNFRRACAIGALAMAALVTGCGGGDGAPPVTAEQPPPGGEPGPQPVPEPGPQPGPDTRAWSTIATLDPNPGGFGFAGRVAMNANGDGFAIWMRGGAAWVSRYTPATGWDTPHELNDSPEPNTLSDSAIAIDAAGNAVAVWLAPDPAGLRHSAWGARYRVGQGWSSGVTLESNNEDDAGGAIQLRMDPAGNAYAVWRMSGEEGASLYFQRYSADGVWEDNGQVPGSHGNQLSEPALAMAPGGAATVGWIHRGESDEQIVVTRQHSPTGGWSNAQVIAAVENPRASNLWEALLDLRVDADGNVVAAWQQVREDVVNEFELWTARRAPGEAWRGQARLSATDVFVQGFAVDADAAGNAVLTWTQSSTTQDPAVPKLFASVRPAGGAWSLPVQVSNANDGFAYAPGVVMDAQGGAVAMWLEWTEAGGQLWTARLRGGQWGGQAVLDAPAGFELHVPRLAVNAAGKGLAIWTRNSGTGSFTVHGSALQ